MMDIKEYCVRENVERIDIFFDYGLGKSNWTFITCLSNDLILQNDYGHIIRFKAFGKAPNAPIYITHLERNEKITFKVLM